MNGDTESNVDTAREHAEKLISDGAQLLVGTFDSGQTTAVAQVAEQKGIPFVINIAGAPDITEQGYKFVFQKFPDGADAGPRRLFAEQMDVFEITGIAPKTAVFMRVNDTVRHGMSKALPWSMPNVGMPYTIRRKSPTIRRRVICRSR